jgi:hypothetical protein
MTNSDTERSALQHLLELTTLYREREKIAAPFEAPAHGCCHSTLVQQQKMSYDAICPHCDRMTPFLFCLPGETAEKKRGCVAFLGGTC